MLWAVPLQEVDGGVGIVAHVAQDPVIALDRGQLGVGAQELAQIGRGVVLAVGMLGEEARPADLAQPQAEADEIGEMVLPALRGDVFADQHEPGIHHMGAVAQPVEEIVRLARIARAADRGQHRARERAHRLAEARAELGERDGRDALLHLHRGDLRLGVGPDIEGECARLHHDKAPLLGEKNHLAEGWRHLLAGGTPCPSRNTAGRAAVRRSGAARSRVNRDRTALPGSS